MDKKNNSGFSSLSSLATEVNTGNEDVNSDATTEQKPTKSTLSSLDSAEIKTNNEPGSLRDTDITSTKNSIFINLKKTAIQFSKWFFILTVLAFVLFFGINHISDMEELQFNKDGIEWRWHEKENKIQKSTNTEKILLRRVYKNNDYEIIAFKNNDYFLNAIVRFVTPCTPNTEIVTSSKWSNGDPKILYCDENGRYLSFSIIWNKKGTNIDWSENFDGFSFTENFRDWDFTIIDKQITLSNAKKPAE